MCFIDPTSNLVKKINYQQTRQRDVSTGRQQPVTAVLANWAGRLIVRAIKAENNLFALTNKHLYL
jgi:hypothetical protein